jgi:gamma-glutamyltranspeptidase/glutathione hydrolase
MRGSIGRAALLSVLGLAVGHAHGAQPGRAAIASAHPLATEAGFEILRAGGNAFDAAVAVSAALAVVEPESSGLGGGGFFLLRYADGRAVFLDARETAPSGARRERFLAADGTLDREKALNSALAAGIPGLPAALERVAVAHGRLPLARTLAPAIRLASEGFPAGPKYRRLAAARLAVLRRDPTAARIFLREGEVPKEGTLIVQPELAEVLRRLASEGSGFFYRGGFAERLAAEVRRLGGVWTGEDLATYRLREREPLRIRHGEAEILTAPPPSAGGVALATGLAILERFPWRELGPVDRAHLLAETWRRTFRDRAEHLGDPDFVEVPLGLLTHPAYGAGLAAAIRLDRASESAWLPGSGPSESGADTTHFSIIDSEGHIATVTQTINLPFGAGIVVPGTGILLNNEMDDFALAEGQGNAYGLIGTPPNAPAPGKRMLSSMTPTIVIGGERVAALGSPGGSRIVSMVMLAVLDVLEGRSAEEVVARPRIHHQFLPDVLSAEQGALDAAAQAALGRRGHRLLVEDRPWGNMQIVIWDRRRGLLEAASDPRWALPGSARVERTGTEEREQ